MLKAPKLTTENVQEIRERLETGEAYRTIAKDYGVSYNSIYLIKKGRLHNGD